MNAERVRTSRFARLTTLDRMFLHLETPDWPGHFGGLAVVEGNALLDGSGQLRIAEIRERVDRRLAHVRQLRQRLYVPGPLGGKPLWVDDPRFDIRHHVHETAIEPPGGDPQLLDAAARLYGRLLNRGRPLWELWFLTGGCDGRVGVLLKLHHSVADGIAAVAIIGSLFDLQPGAPDPVPDGWVPKPVPAAWSLLADNLSDKVRALERAVARLAHPLLLVRGARARVRLGREALGGVPAPRTSLNQVVQAGRRIRSLRLDLGLVKGVAHAHQAKVNDVVLDLWSGGLRALMRHRNESTSGIDLITDMPVSLRSASEAGTMGNQLGFVALPLPIWESDVQRRLDLVVRITGKAKSEQRSADMAGFLAAASAMPLGKYVAARQHSVNVKVTNVIGPPVTVYVLGARILDILPITRLFGNVGLTLCAFSYAGQISLVVTADASAFPDLDVLIAGMEREWHALTGAHGAEAIEGGTPAVEAAAARR
ncbi:MAG TPA: wax ester/triacylglycerol synthase family O-acyltransferase [Actinomycetes bacterium]|jgi:WS/DGAT/MGAT family acyltransferase|nr:wax ester/triacylglycerol synthase family O-acyltransferase [Actinomycetes bacterium]